MTMLIESVETNESEDESVEVSSEGEVEQTVSENHDDQGASNSGWADSIAKILKTNKPKGKRTLILSKAKKLTDVLKTKKKPAGFQIETTEGIIKEEQVEEENENVELQPPKKKKKDLPNLRVKPNILEKDKERTLTKIATRGVVQLFNAVRNQQKDINKKLEEAGPLEVRKDKVLKSIDKRAFLDVLMGEKSQRVDETIGKDVQKQKESTWSVLRDDFMVGARLKDWDKELDKEKEAEQQVEMDSE